MLSNSAVIFSFEKHLQSCFFIFGRFDRKSFDNNVALVILLNVHWIGVGVIQQIREGFVIKLQIGNGDLDLMLITRVNLLEQRRQHSGNDTTIFVIGVGSSHGESFTSTRLPVAQHTAGVAIEGTGEDFLGSEVEDNILGGIGENFLKLEPPLILLVVNYALVKWPIHVDVNLATDIRLKGTLFPSQPACSCGRSWRLASSL